MLFKKKKKSYNVPKKAFEAPLKYRFTFVPEGATFYEGQTVQLSGNINTQRKAFYIACEVFQRDTELRKGKSVAVFYGDVESPDCKDALYGAFNVFE